MSKHAPGISSAYFRWAWMVCVAVTLLFSGGCGSFPRLRSPFWFSPREPDRKLVRTGDDPLRDRNASREKPGRHSDAPKWDDKTEKLIDNQIGHLSKPRQQEIRDGLKDFSAREIPAVLRMMRTRGAFADNQPESNGDRPLTADEYDDRFRDDPRFGHSDPRREAGATLAGHRRLSGSGEDDPNYGSGYRGTDDRRDSQDPQSPNNRSFGRSIIENVRNLTGRNGADSRSGGGLFDSVIPGRNGNTTPPKPDDKPTENLGSEWDESLKRLIAISDAKTSKLGTPTEKNELEYIRNQVYLRMLYMMAGKQEHAVAHIPRISPADQEFWQHTLWGMTDYFREDVLSSRGNRATQTVSHFRTAVTKLREQADLEVRNLVFCRKINSFGNYETMPMKELRYEFRAGDSVLIYAEIDNFKSELTEDDQYRTRLKSTIEIYQDIPAGAGKPTVFDFAPTKDLCRSQRRDYFHSYIVTIPTTLVLGDYKLKLTIQDEVGGKLATETVRFRIN